MRKIWDFSLPIGLLAGRWREGMAQLLVVRIPAVMYLDLSYM